MWPKGGHSPTAVLHRVESERAETKVKVNESEKVVADEKKDEYSQHISGSSKKLRWFMDPFHSE